MSVGNRSGVNWMREKLQSSDRASALTSIVLPTPGKSSMIRCPSLTRQRTTSCSVSSGACTTRATVATMRSTICADDAASTGRGLASIEQRDRRIEHRSRDPRLWRLGDAPFPCARDQDDLVVLRVEADVASRHIVVDDEVDLLVGQHRPLALEPGFPVLGAEGHDHLAVLAPGGQGLDDVLGRLELDRPRLCPFGALRG